MSNNVKLGITGRINAYFFYQMYVESLKESVCHKNVLDWCMKAGLIASSYKCPACKESMTLKKRQNLRNDKWIWICRKDNHDKSRTVRRGTCFDNSNMSMCEILLLIWYWLNKYSQQSVINEIGCATLTVSDWYGFCREVCIEVCIKTSEKIGGTGRVVEFEESKFGKRKKTKNADELRWVYVGVEKDTDKYFFVVKPLRSKECMYQTLRDWILPGTTIISDCWALFDCLEDEDFQLLKDLKDLTFQDSKEIGVPGNFGRGGFSSVRKNMSKFNDQYDGHLAEYMWRRKNKADIQQEFVSFLGAIKMVYPVQTSDKV